jgi:hypothetical protein
MGEYHREHGRWERLGTPRRRLDAKILPTCSDVAPWNGLSESLTLAGLETKGHTALARSLGAAVIGSRKTGGSGPDISRTGFPLPTTTPERIRSPQSPACMGL